MNPQEQLCHNPQCWVYGRQGEGAIVISSQRDQRYRCKRCGKTFSATTGTALYRLHKPHTLVCHRRHIARLWVSAAGDRCGLWAG